MEVIDAETYSGEMQLQNEQLIFFVMATHGDGEPTDNATDFYRWLIDVANNCGGETLCKVGFLGFIFFSIFAPYNPTIVLSTPYSTIVYNSNNNN